MVNAVGAHHDDIEMESPIAVLVQSADSISGARPGARRESLENYIKRLQQLEEIATSFDGVTKTFASLAGLIFMLLMISQFIAFFNYTNMPQVVAIWMADALEQANIGALPLLIGFVLVIMLLNFIIPNVVPKWAIFAPIFIPVFLRLGVTPQTVLAAYRLGDSPTNVITPLMVYLPFVLTIVQRYQKDAGIGTDIALMLPYTRIIAVAWIVLFIVWFVVGIPLGPGYPVSF